MTARRKFNLKRRIRQTVEETTLSRLADRVGYSGNPQHKLNPGDFNLTPPSSPRLDKTLCDGAKIFLRGQAQSLLREGVLRGLISVQERSGLPQNIWAVSNNGIPLEAQLDNENAGTYHGYPMQDADPLSAEILDRWNQRRNDR